MGKIKEVKIDQFDGGISRDTFIQSSNQYALTKHFDTFTQSKRLVPYKATESTSENKTLDIVKFLHAPFGASSFRLYGLGTSSGENAIYINDITSGIDEAWGTPTDNAASSGGRNEDVFFYYKNYIYMFDNGSNLQRWGDVTGTPAFTESYQSLTHTNVAQPVHHPADDVAYFFTDNLVHSLDNTTWTGSVLTLPNNLIITTATDFGNYLAIGCRPKTPTSGSSVVFLWDRDSSLTTISAKIDWGAGDLKHLANLNGRLYGVTDFYMSNTLGYDEGRIIVKVANGNTAIVTSELVGNDTVTSPAIGFAKQVVDNRLYFPARIDTVEGDNEGIWVVDQNGQITLDFVEEDVTADQKIQGIFRTGNVWWIAHSNDGSVNHTNDQASYTYTSTYQSQQFTGGDMSITKKLNGVTVMTEALPANGQVVLKYRKDEETAWTTIFTNTTDNSVQHSSVNIESSGAGLPQFNYIQFQILSTGGAVITGLKFQYEELDDRNY